MGSKRGIIFYPEQVKIARDLLSDAEIGKLFLGVIDYAETGKMIESESKPINALFGLMRDTVDRNAKAYEQTCERNRQNVKKRWEQKNSTTVYESNPSNTTVCDGIRLNTTHTNITEHNITEQNNLPYGREGVTDDAITEGYYAGMRMR